jgi:hypothetical protein
MKRVWVSIGCCFSGVQGSCERGGGSDPGRNEFDFYLKALVVERPKTQLTHLGSGVGELVRFLPNGLLG